MNFQGIRTKFGKRKDYRGIPRCDLPKPQQSRIAAAAEKRLQQWQQHHQDIKNPNQIQMDFFINGGDVRHFAPPEQRRAVKASLSINELASAMGRGRGWGLGRYSALNHQNHLQTNRIQRENDSNVRIATFEPELSAPSKQTFQTRRAVTSRRRNRGVLHFAPARR